MEVIKWEYKEIKQYDQNELNELGKQGWESYGYNSNNSLILLKRPCGTIKIEEQVVGAKVVNKTDFDLDRC